MNKSAAIILAAVAVGASVFFLKTRSDADKPQKETTETAPRRPALTGNRPASNAQPSSFLENQLVSNLRAAIASRDQALIEKAFEELVAFINEHPELAGEYLEALRTEPEEQLLRGLAKAMQRSQALMGSDDFIKSIVDIAQQQGFEQRQHIMLDTLAQAAQVKPELFDAMKKMSEATEQPSQVRASAIAVYADWMVKFPEKSGMIIDELGRALKDTNDDNVRALSVQLLALHRENLPRDVQMALADRLAKEPFPAGQNLICSALSSAPSEIRDPVFRYLQNQFSSQTDPNAQRLTLAQMVILNPMEMRPTLEQLAKGNTELAEDAREYLVAVNLPGFSPEKILASVPVMVDPNAPAHQHTEGCKH